MAAKELDNKQQYIESIKFLVPINELTPQLQNEVINICKLFAYKKKDFVFKQGDKDGYAFYILDGEIELLSDKHVTSSIVSGTNSARYAMARLQPRQFSAKAITEIVILRIDRAALDRLMVVEQKEDDFSTGSMEVEVSDIGEEDSGDWMTKMLQSELFCRLPTANIQQLFVMLEPVEFSAGDTVIKQGDVGEHFFIIQEGRCEVVREPSPGAKAVKLAELRSGDSFGEEALLTEAKRNASIIMKTDGVLMQLSKENFINLIKKPTLEEVSFQQAEKLVNEGATWLDVRFPNEYEESKVPGSINIPINILRMQTEKLDKEKKYVIYCDTGGRSSAAAFLLTDRGYNVCFLNNGLSSVPADKLESKTPAPAPAPEKKKEKKAETAPSAKEEKPEDDKELEKEIRSSVLDVNLEKTNMDLEKAVKDSMADNEEKAKEAKEAQKKLMEEKKKLEAEKAAAEKEAKKEREKEAAKLEKLKKEAEKRLAEEKKKIEEIYARNTREMEKLQKLKEQAEAQIRKEREKLEKEAAEAKKKNVEVEEMKKQLEASRASIEKEAEMHRLKQEEMEKSIQAKAKAKLEEEKRKLAEEYARTNEEVGSAQRAQAVAEAARKAAQEEAKNIIAEYKKQFEEERAREQERLQEERNKLESESQKIQDTLKEIQKSKELAEATRIEAEKEARLLRERQISSTGKEVDVQIKAAEERLKAAEKNLETAQQAEVTITEARKVNEEELRRQKAEVEKYSKSLADDLASFVEEHKETDTGKSKTVSHADHTKRIRERAAAAKKDAESATDSLFADIAAQLGKDD